MLQLSGNCPAPGPHRHRHGRRHGRLFTLVDLKEGQQAVIERLELPEGLSRRLMELGFLPGNTVEAAASAPGGDPRVFRVDGSEVALRRDTARQVILQAASNSPSP